MHATAEAVVLAASLAGSGLCAAASPRDWRHRAPHAAMAVAMVVAMGAPLAALLVTRARAPVDATGMTGMTGMTGAGGTGVVPLATAAACLLLCATAALAAHWARRGPSQRVLLLPHAVDALVMAGALLAMARGAPVWPTVAVLAGCAGARLVLARRCWRAAAPARSVRAVSEIGSALTLASLVGMVLL